MSTSLQTNNNHVNHFACSEQFYTTTESHYPTQIISPYDYVPPLFIHVVRCYKIYKTTWFTISCIVNCND